MPIFVYQSIHMVAYVFAFVVVVVVDAVAVAAVDVVDEAVALFPDMLSILRPLSKFQHSIKTIERWIFFDELSINEWNIMRNELERNKCKQRKTTKQHQWTYEIKRLKKMLGYYCKYGLLGGCMNAFKCLTMKRFLLIY